MKDERVNSLTATAIFSISLGVLVAFGWVYNVPVFKTVIPGYVSMKFNTALCFIFSGISFFLLIKGKSKTSQRAYLFTAALVTLVALTTLLEYFFKMDLNIDQFFIADLERVTNQYPGRMAIATSICFAAIGLAFMGIKSNHSYVRILSQWLLHGSTALSFIAILGYLLQVPILYKFTAFTSMSIHTSAGILLLSIMASLKNADTGIAGLFTGYGIGNIMAKHLFPKMMLIVLALGFLCIESYRHHLVEVEFGIALYTFSFAMVILVFIRNSSSMLNKIDANRTKAENEIIALNSNLEKIVSLRTADLTQAIDQLNVQIMQTQELRQNIERKEKQFRELVEKAGDLIYEVNSEGKFSYVNPVAESISGYDKETLFSMYYLNLIHPAFIEKVGLFYKNQLDRKEEISDYEVPLVSKSGEIIWISQRTRMFFTNGQLEMIRVVGHDVSELYRSRQALQMSEKRFKSLSENSPIGIFELDAGRTVRFINKKWYQIMGLDPALHNSHEARVNAIHPEDREKVLSTLKEVDEGDGEVSKEYRIITPHQQTGWVQTSVTKVMNEDNSTYGYIGTLSDITEIKLAEQKLKESEKNYRLLSENSTDLIALHTLDGKFQYLSPSVKEFLGYEAEELLGKDDLEFVYEKDKGKILEARQKEQMLDLVEFRLKRKDGSVFWTETIAKRIQDESGNVIAIQTSTRNITQRKEFEQALKIAKEKAEEASIAKSQFLSTMSHEIRTPMNGVIGLTNFLLEENPRPDQIESLNLLKFSGENLLVIINDILDFSKIEAGKVELEKVPFNLREVIQNSIQLLRHRAQNKGIDLFLRYSETLPETVLGDQVKIAQVVNNLVGNSIKFTPTGYIEIIIKSDGSQNGNPLISFTVRDTGIGIAEDKQSQIFDSFSQATSDTNRKFGGTGLGLSITKRLLNLMGSDITVKSKLGEGSEFHFSIELPTGDKSPSEQRLELEITSRCAGIKILIVDDNRINQVVAANYLRKWGFVITFANDGKEALARVREETFQMILMDLQMPEMDGYEATAQIHSMDNGKYSKIPILALTASAMIGYEKEILEAGMIDIVTKPFKAADLKSKILQYLFEEKVSDRSS